jgi:hypothetical protein
MKTRFAVAALLLCTLTIPAVADVPSCAGITDNKSRLACREQARRSYRSHLEGALFDRGSIAGIFVEETGDHNSGAYPKLIVWTVLDKATVYRLIDEAKVLEGARESGFRMVQFTDKGNDGHWFFDLTRPGIWPINIQVENQALPALRRRLAQPTPE